MKRATFWRRLFIFFLLSISLIGEGLAQTLPPGFTSSTVSSGWVQPMGVAFTKNGGKMFVWEKGGKVFVCDWNSSTSTYVKQTTPVLDLTEEVGNYSDYGLMGLAIDPDFDTNGLFYLLYVVDRHHLLKYGTASYSSTANEYYNATIGRVTRYKTIVNSNGQTVADLATRKILLGETKKTGIPLLYDSHGLGMLVFAEDKTLLISTGDGASYNGDDMGPNVSSYYAQALADSIIRPAENVGAFRSQLVNCFNGKILRIDPQTGDGIPSNPFYQVNAPRSPQSRVWAMGLRNPFRFVVRPNTGSPLPSAGDVGDIYVGDVGYGTYEEINIITAPGTNCGWPIFEGITYTPGSYSQQAGNVLNRDEPNPLYGINGCSKQFFSFADLIKQATADENTTVYNPCDPTKPITGSTGNRYFHRVPALDWAHSFDSSRVKVFNGNTIGVAQIGTSASGVTGTPFRGSSSTGGCWYQGTMLPANYRNTYFFGDYSVNWVKYLTVESADKIQSVTPFTSNLTGFVFIGENPLDGSLFAVDIGASVIRRIAYGGNQAPVAKIRSDKTYGPTPVNVQFNGSDSYDPEGSNLTYLWDFGDGTTSTAANPSRQFSTANNLPKKFVVKLTVKDPSNAVGIDSIVISLNNTPPVVNITSPEKNAYYLIGPDTTYALRANVTDTEHSSSQLFYRWQVFLRHNTHEHPDPVDTNKITTAKITRVGCNGDTYYWFFHLTVTDAAGLSTVDSAKIFPACATAPPTVQTHPQPQTVCAEQQVTFSSTVNDLTISAIQWQKSVNGGTTWTNISGAVTASYSFTPTTLDNLALYRVAWSNSMGTTYTNAALLTVKPLPFAPAAPAQQSFCFAATIADLYVAGTDIKWYGVSTAGRPLASSTQLISGTHYYATQTVDGCESKDRLEVLATISASSSTIITLNGSNSSGNISSYQWTLESGPNIPVISNANAAMATASKLVKGVYIFKLSVNNGAAVSKVLVHVNPSDTLFMVHAGFDRSITLPTSSIRLDASGSSGAVSYQWSLLSGPGTPLIQTPQAVSTTVSGLAEGTYAFQLTAKNSSNVSAYDTVMITVNPETTIGTAPVINAQHVQNNANSTVVNTLSNVPAGSTLVLSLSQVDNASSVFTATQAVQPPTGNAINDGTALSIGMKFRSTVDGYVTGIRFYKASNNTGTHTGELYTSSGVRLAQAVFVNETASGWQKVNLSTPVLISKNQTYIVSYHSSAGFYSETADYFVNPVITSPLEGLADGADGPNGLYIYSSAPSFPVNTFAKSNYWVDVVFSQADAVVSSTPSLTWVKRSDAGSGTRANAEIYTAEFINGGNISVSSKWEKGTISSALYSVSNTDPAFMGIDGNASLQSLPSVSVQTKRSNSLLFAATGDLNAVNGSARTYRDGAIETYYHYVAGAYTGYHYRKPTTSATTYTQGLTAPSGMLAGTAIFELAGKTTSTSILIADAGYNQKIEVAIPPDGQAVQSFCNQATIADLRVAGTSIKWYDSSVGGNQLADGHALVHGRHYFATQTINGCESVERLDVQAAIYPPPATPTITQNTLCTGAIQLTTNASGSKLWSNGDTSSTVTVSQSGIYSVTINPGTACSSTGFAQVTISSPIFSAAISGKQHNNCYGERTGSLAVTATGGTPTYQYLWSTGATSSAISNLAAGPYYVIVSDNSGCSLLLYDTIKQPDSPLNISVTKTNIYVYGASTGSLLMSASGGVPGYSYSIDGSNFQVSGSFGSLSAGDYTVYVKDATGCIQRESVSLTQPASALLVEMGSSTSILCFGDSSGSISVGGSGGIPPYQYKLNNGAYQGLPTFNRLPAGNYSVIIRDSVGTTDTLLFTLTQPAALPGFSVNKTDIQCSTGTGSIVISATGGTAPYTYSLTGGNSYQESNLFGDLTSGNYSIRIRDQHNCLSSLQTVSINLSSSSIQLTGNLSSGSISSYLWSLVSGPNTPVIQSPTSVNTTVSGLIKGRYVFRLSVNGGVSTSLVTVNVDPSQLKADAGYDRIIYLPSSSIKLDGNGSTGNNIVFGWSMLSGPNTPVFSAANIASPTVSGLAQGVYAFKLSITDASNNISLDTVSVTVSALPLEGNRPVINAINNKTSTSNTVTNALSNVPKGALLVLTLAQGGDITATNGAQAVVTSSPTLVWTKRADAGATGSGNAEIYSAVFAAGGKISIKSVWGANAISASVYVITNYNSVLDGASASANSQSTPNLSILSNLSNSLLIGVTSDRNARAGTTRRYLDTAIETQYYFRSGVFASYHYRKFTYGKGNYVEGLSAPTGMSAGTAFFEVKGNILTVTPVVAHAGYNQSIACVSGDMITRKASSPKVAAENTLSSLRVLPNPGYGQYRLYYEGIHPGNVLLRVTDSHGRILLQKIHIARDVVGAVELDLIKQPGGVYFVQLLHAGGMITERVLRL